LEKLKKRTQKKGQVTKVEKGPRVWNGLKKQLGNKKAYGKRNVREVHGDLPVRKRPRAKNG